PGIRVATRTEEVSVAAGRHGDAVRVPRLQQGVLTAIPHVDAALALPYWGALGLRGRVLVRRANADQRSHAVVLGREPARTSGGDHRRLGQDGAADPARRRGSTRSARLR